jgi:hypothetical protein
VSSSVASSQSRNGCLGSRITSRRLTVKWGREPMVRGVGEGESYQGGGRSRDRRRQYICQWLIFRPRKGKGPHS